MLAYAAKNFSGDIVDEILNNQMFDYKSYQIINAFVQSFKDPSKVDHHSHFAKSSVVEIMNKIYKFDLSHARLIDLSKLLKNGKSFFTSIKSNYYKIEDVCNFLLIHGVDPNMPDKNGVFPLQHSIEKGLHNLTTFLIDSNKIVLSQLPNGNSYLHLSISCSNSNAFQFFIKKKLIDINTVNDKGETPLMEACRTGDLLVVDLLFQQENLDYLHCDKNGNDALKLLKSLSPEEEKEARQSRDCYYRTLIPLVKKILYENDFNY